MEHDNNLCFFYNKIDSNNSIITREKIKACLNAFKQALECDEKLLWKFRIIVKVVDSGST